VACPLLRHIENSKHKKGKDIITEVDSKRKKL